MRYISEVIGYPEGVVPSLFYSTKEAGSYVRVVVMDTETGGTETFYGDETDELLKEGVLGCTGQISFTKFAVVSDTAKTIQVHKYIESVEFKQGSSRNWALTDICILNLIGRPTHQRVDGRFMLTVELGAASVRLCGAENSVCIRQNGTGTILNVYNMYDFLGSLCRDCELDIMKYSTIRLYTRAGDNSSITTIKLKHTPEADRFFTKMYLDVMKR